MERVRQGGTLMEPASRRGGTLMERPASGGGKP